MMAAILLVALACVGVISAQAQLSYEQQVRPVLTRYCSSCHNEKVATAGLNLNAYMDAEVAKRSPQVWEKVLEKLNTGKMPPPGLPSPKPEERNTVAQWIQSFVSPDSSSNDPGRVTARRLNRLEYNLTVRDLLHVHARPADEFPVDDSGYGFDNIGDVLSLSPMLMEKYLAAARKLSRLAVYGEPLPPKPTTLGRYVSRRSPDATGTLTAPGITPFSLRGSLFTTHVFPWTAEYEFRFRVVNFRYVLRRRNAPPLSPEEAKKLFPPIDAILTLDGKRIASATVEGSLAHDYERGDIVARVPITAGEHQIRISFPDLADMKDPRDNVNPDQRRKLWVDFLNIVGPFETSQEPSESYKALFVCGHTRGKHQPSCARKIIRNFATHAYRRPITEPELSKLLNVAALARNQSEPFEEGIRLAVQAVLVSPHFLFRIERDSATPDTKPHRISDYELASRLSYFLWSSMPDEELFRLAGENRLHDPSVLEAQVRRMLADEKASSLIDGFTAQWLQLRHLGRVRPDPKRFSAVDDELLNAMREETRLFVAEIIRNDRSVLDFLDAPFTYLNGPLARHYDIPGVSGEKFQRVAINGDQRGGLMTQASVLTVSSYPTRTSPVLRGKWILENLLGAPPPPPPPDVPELKDENLGAASLREQLEIHRANPSCATCHDQMDPLGFGLENYDAVGAWRTHDSKFPIDASGTLPGGTKFNGPRELVGILKSRSGVFERNLTERLMTYALGRGLTRSDNSAVNSIVERSAGNGHRFSSIVLGIITSTPFQMRRAEKGGSEYDKSAP